MERRRCGISFALELNGVSVSCWSNARRPNATGYIYEISYFRYWRKILLPQEDFVMKTIGLYFVTWLCWHVVTTMIWTRRAFLASLSSPGISWLRVALGSTKTWKPYPQKGSRSGRVLRCHPWIARQHRLMTQPSMTHLKCVLHFV